MTFHGKVYLIRLSRISLNHNALMLTSGGRHSSACLRRTENPPWVLVSEAVSLAEGMDSAFLKFLWLRVQASEFALLIKQIQGT
jgi:hypothetical protein